MDSDLSSKLTDIDFNVRYDALDDVTDEQTLIEVATDDVDDYIRYKAFKLLKIHHPDSFILFDSYFVSKCSDELLLTYIVKDSMYSSPKLVCGKPISKDIVVPYLVLYDTRWEIRASAVGNPRLRDENLLKDVVFYDYHHGVRRAALENPNLKIQPLFELIGLHESEYGLRIAAAKRIESEEVLSEIALNDERWAVRRSAIENVHLKNQDPLIKAALNDPIIEVRMAAIEKITDENALMHMADKDKVKKVRTKAAERLNELDTDLNE